MEGFAAATGDLLDYTIPLEFVGTVDIYWNSIY